MFSRSASRNRFSSAVSRTIAGTASFNVTPFSTGSYFDKIACFCFELQELAPGERVEMPVTFFVDPAMLEKEELKDAPTITLSYTFFPVSKGEAPVAAARQGGSEDQL